MRLIKMFGLAAMAAVAAMAFVGATSASANTDTSLCAAHASLTCASPYTAAGTATTPIHFLNEGVGSLLNELQIVLCLEVLANVKILGAALGKPLALDVSLNYTGCGTDANHDNCVVTEEGGPTKGTLLKTGLDKGTQKADGGQIVRQRVKCEDLTIFKIDIDCKYNPSGIEFEAGALKVKAEKTPVTPDAANSFICPDESTIDGTMKALAATPAHILG